MILDARSFSLAQRVFFTNAISSASHIEAEN